MSDRDDQYDRDAGGAGRYDRNAGYGKAPTASPPTASMVVIPAAQGVGSDRYDGRDPRGADPYESNRYTGDQDPDRRFAPNQGDVNGDGRYAGHQGDPNQADPYAADPDQGDLNAVDPTRPRRLDPNQPDVDGRNPNAPRH
ncbi:hypothetical protein IOD13_04065 [Brevibacterium casei]|nr:hypothetical protein [Brevibacterium casei]